MAEIHLRYQSETEGKTTRLEVSIPLDGDNNRKANGDNSTPQPERPSRIRAVGTIASLWLIMLRLFRP